MTGEGIPFRKLGFDSLGAFLTSLPDTLIVRRLPTGGMMVALTGTGQQRSNSQGQVIFTDMQVAWNVPIFYLEHKKPETFQKFCRSQETNKKTQAAINKLESSFK